MPRGYRRRYRSYRSAKSKYSNETTSLLFTVPQGGIDAGTTFPFGVNQEGDRYVGAVVVPSTKVYGSRKAKNFDISLTTNGTMGPIVAALVYVPEGTLPSSMNIAAFNNDSFTSLYEPNQNVIGQFVIPASFDESSQTVTRFKTRLARNLDSGDSICLIFANAANLPANSQICGTVNYAIKY